MLVRNSVLLLKSQISEDRQDKYEALLKANDFEVRQVKTLLFNFKNIDVLRGELQQNDKYSGLILSSPRCVEAVQLALEGNTCSEQWQEKQNFVVGEATHRAALDKLSLNCLGKDSGHAGNLAKVIIQNKSEYCKPFLFPHGNLRSDTLSMELGKEGVLLEGLEVYDTVGNPNIAHDMTNVTDDFHSICEFVVFFSPSGVSSTMKWIQKVPVDLAQIKFIAIGPVTKMAITEMDLPVYGVAKRPNPEELLNVILNK